MDDDAPARRLHLGHSRRDVVDEQGDEPAGIVLLRLEGGDEVVAVRHRGGDAGIRVGRGDPPPQEAGVEGGSSLGVGRVQLEPAGAALRDCRGVSGDSSAGGISARPGTMSAGSSRAVTATPQ